MQRNLLRPFTLRAESIDAPERAIIATIATEAPVETFDWQSGRIIRETLLMSGVEIAAHIPLLTDHARQISNMIGDVQEVRVEGDQLAAALRFAAGTPAADQAWKLYGQKFGRQVSVGYRVLAAEEIPAGRSRFIAGRNFTAPRNAHCAS